MAPLNYLSGFANHLQSEAIEGALPKDQNSPQICPLNLYAEQLSGSAFTVPRPHNVRSWLYRIRPSVAHPPFVDAHINNSLALADHDMIITPNQLRWSPLTVPADVTNWLQGLRLMASAGDPAVKNGIAIYMYAANANMTDEALYNSDGDFLIGNDDFLSRPRKRGCM